MNSRRTESRNNGRSIASAAHQSRRDDELVVAALEEYFELLQGGSPPPRDEFLGAPSGDRRHPCRSSHGPRAGASCRGPVCGNGSGSEYRRSAAADDFGGIPSYSRGRPWRHGCRIRSRAAFAWPSGRAQGVAVSRVLGPASVPTVPGRAQAAALLHHEHIVPVFGIGSDEGIHYYAMQFIDGRSLTEVIRELRPAPRRDAFADASTSDYGPSRTDGEPLLPPPQSSGSFSNNRHHFETAQLGLQAALASSTRMKSA